MKNILILYLALIGAVLYSSSCTKESTLNNEEEIEIEIDSFQYLTPCLIDIVTDYNSYVLNDTIPDNDDYYLEQIRSMQIDSLKYYWLKTNWEDETEYILTKECDIFCTYDGWTGFEDACLPEFRDSIWTIAWQR